MKIKKLIAVLALLTLSLTGCSGKEKNNKNTITASFYPVYITALNIVNGTDTEVTTLAKPSAGCLHDYQLTTGDIRALSRCSLFIINGAGMESSFIEEAIATNPALDVLDSSEGITPLGEDDCGYEGEQEHSHGDEHNHGVNSHIWLLPENAAVQAKNITQKLCGVHPENADIYRANADEYISKLNVLKSEYGKIEIKKPINAIILNEGFEYFCKPYGINTAYSIELDENTTASARELAEIADNSKDGSYIILAPADEYSSFASALSRELKIPVFELDPVTYGSLEDKDSYLKAMEKNLAVLKEISEL